MTHPSAARDLPVRRDLGLAYGSSLLVCLALALVSVAGLLGSPDAPVSVGSPLVQVSPGCDAANLILGLPALLGSMWFVRRGSLIGLLLWPCALFYALYDYALYLIGGGAVPLIQQPALPDVIRIASAFEILAQKFPLGVLVAFLFLPAGSLGRAGGPLAARYSRSGPASRRELREPQHR